MQQKQYFIEMYQNEYIKKGGEGEGEGVGFQINSLMLHLKDFEKNGT